MPQYRFKAKDKNGALKQGTVDAESKDQALAKIGKNGFSNISIEQVETSNQNQSNSIPWYNDYAQPDSRQQEQVLPTILPSQYQQPVATYDQQEPRNYVSPELYKHLLESKLKERKANALPLILSGIVVALSIATCTIVLLRDPFGGGISKYDFSSPEASAKSEFQIEASRDLAASFDLGSLRSGDSNEKLRTLEVNRTADYSDKKLLFVSYLQKGKKVKRVQAFEKDLGTKMWIPVYISRFEIGKLNEQLSKDILAWEGKDND